jgi:polar amino acid transport system substrate-binding protein
MRAIHWIVSGVFGVLLSGCATTQIAPTPEARQALVATGKLRVAFLAAAIYATKDPSTGELRGVAVDLGKELARRIGAPFQPVPYPNPGAITAGARSGEWDVALMGINAERAAAIDFSAPYMEVEQGYLVRAGVPIAAASDVDRPGIRIAVIARAGADLHLSGTLKHATLVRIKNVGEVSALLESGKVDVIAVTKAALFGLAANQPGSRVLDGRFLVEPIGIGVPKGRDAAASRYVGEFVEAAKAEGLVKSAIERAGLRGVVVAALK